MKSSLSSHISIAEQIIDGSISINSTEEFKSILKIFPNDPALQKAYSNLLLKKNALKRLLNPTKKQHSCLSMPAR